MDHKCSFSPIQATALLLFILAIPRCVAQTSQHSSEHYQRIAELHREASTESLIATLSDADYLVRKSAESALLARGKDIIPALSDALDGESVNPLFQIIHQLGPDAEKLIPKLTEMLGNERWVFEATLCIDRIQPGAIQQLPAETRAKAAAALYDAILDPENAQMAGFCIRILPAYGSPAAPFLLKLLRSDNANLRVAGARSVFGASFHDSDLESTLSELINSDDVLTVRGKAARVALNPLYQSDLMFESIINLFAEMLEDGRPEARRVASDATYALIPFGNVTVAKLVPILEAGGDKVRANVVNIWKQIDAPIELAELLEHEHESVSLAASVSLMRRGPMAAKEVAKKLISSNEAVRRRAANTLATMRVEDDAIVSTLIEVAGNEANSSPTRIAAARAALLQNPQLARHADAITSLIPELIAALEDDAFMLRGDAAEALGLIGPAAKEAIPALEENLRLKRGTSGTDQINDLYVTERAKEALQSINQQNDR